MANKLKKAIVLAGSRGIGSAIAKALSDVDLNVAALSKSDLDTSDLDQCLAFCNQEKNTDVLVLNTGGPPAKPFSDITLGEWEQCHRQLFLGFVIFLQNLQVNDGGYIFLISSNNIKEPDPNLILSNAYRIAFTSLFKSVSRDLAAREVSCINIAPGPMDTDRLKSLVADVGELGKTLPMKRVGKPEEIGRFVSSIIENDVKYLSGVTINFDGALSKGVL